MAHGNYITDTTRDKALEMTLEGLSANKISESLQISKKSIQTIRRCYKLAIAGDASGLEKFSRYAGSTMKWAQKYLKTANDDIEAEKEQNDNPAPVSRGKFSDKERVDLIVDINYLIGLLTGSDPQDPSLAVTLCREYLEGMYDRHYKMLFPDE